MFQDLPIKDIYLSGQDQRYSRIVQQFKDRYGVDPDFITRAPGRVNLIG